MELARVFVCVRVAVVCSKFSTDNRPNRSKTNAWILSQMDTAAVWDRVINWMLKPNSASAPVIFAAIQWCDTFFSAWLLWRTDALIKLFSFQHLNHYQHQQPCPCHHQSIEEWFVASIWITLNQHECIKVQPLERQTMLPMTRKTCKHYINSFVMGLFVVHFCGCQYSCSRPI